MANECEGQQQIRDRNGPGRAASRLSFLYRPDTDASWHPRCLQVPGRPGCPGKDRPEQARTCLPRYARLRRTIAGWPGDLKGNQIMPKSAYVPIDQNWFLSVN